MAEVLIGIDDTDLPGTRGTGKLARDLADYLGSRGAGMVRGITRHQLLLHPSIRYTSHNSAACIVLDSYQEPAILSDVCNVFLKDNVVPGSDSGLVVTARSWISSDVIDFGNKAQTHLLSVEQANMAFPKRFFLVGALESFALQLLFGALGGLAAGTFLWLAVRSERGKVKA